MSDALGLLIFFGSGLSLLLAATGLASPAAGGKPLLRSALLALIGCLLLEFFLTHSLGFVADMATRPLQTEIFLLVRCAKYSLGPLLFAHVARLTTYREPRLVELAPHFLPQLAAWALSLVYMVSSLAGWSAFAPLRTIMGLVTDLSLVHLVTYVVVACLVARTTGNRTAVVAGLAVATVCGCMVGLLTVYWVTGWKLLELGSMGLLAAALVAFFVLLQIRPDTLDRFGRMSRQRTYQRSLLTEVDTELLTLRLKDLMENEQVYCDEELTLESLAEKLQISRNRLSELLNGVLQTSFSAYVNRHRVEEVKRLLREQPGRSILAHAYAAGFNSKSVFYDAFRRFAGMTPQAYRDQAQAS